MLERGSEKLINRAPGDEVVIITGSTASLQWPPKGWDAAERVHPTGLAHLVRLLRHVRVKIDFL